MICVTLERTPVIAWKCGSKNERKIAVYKWLNLKSADLADTLMWVQGNVC